MAGPRGPQHSRRPSHSITRLFLVAVCVICIALLRNHAWQSTLEAEGVAAGVPGVRARVQRVTTRAADPPTRPCSSRRECRL